MNFLSFSKTLTVVFFLSSFAAGAELRFAGSLGNSGESGDTLVTFSEQTASGMGPVIDDALTIWERGGSGKLNRYALDGRLLASFAIPASTERSDQLTRAGDLLVMKIGRGLFTLPLDAVPGTAATRLAGEAEILSSSSFEGKVAVFAKSSGEVSWLDPATGERTPALKPDFRVTDLHPTGDGTLYLFGGGEVRAWKDGELLPGFPLGFNGERPRKIGRFWYSFSWHGTINRMNDQFEPDPGVVLGGASGSFIGYLPESVDLTLGRGIALVRDGIHAVSGLEGVVQLLQWNGAEERFEVVRRIGALPGLNGVALDAAGNIWTPHGSWRWDDSAETPNTLGDKRPDVMAQPVVLDGQTLCLLKKHYSSVQLARGPFIDASGWSHFDTPGIKNFELPDSVSGAAVVPDGNGLTLIAVERGGQAFELGINEAGQLRSAPKPVTLPGLQDCTSLAWFDGHLIAADGGELVAFQRDGDGNWKETSRRADFGAEIYVHGDGARLAVSDTENGTVHLFDSLGNPLATRSGLQAPRHLAVSGDRLAVFEAGRQRLVKLELSADEKPAPAFAAKPAPPAKGKIAEHGEANFQDLGRPGGIPFSVALTPEKSGLSLSIQTAADAEIRIGVANRQNAYLLTNASGSGSQGRLDFRLPAGDWSEIRLAAALKSSGQRERFGFLDRAPIHAPFSDAPATWAPFDLDAYRETVTARQQEIRLTFEQAVAGKATLVIENEAGQRIRNLVSGRSLEAGKHTVIWDGLDETGNLIAPGTYHWRGITHPGIEPVYRMHFANGGEETTAPWGPNHSTFHHAATNGELVFFAAPVTEGGWALVALDADGKLVQGYEHQHGFGIQHDAIAADERYLYCAQDGFAWGGTKGVDFKDAKWTATWSLTVVRYDIASGKMIEFPGKRRALEVGTMEVGPGSDHPDLSDFNLGGLAVAEGRLYVGSRARQAVLVLDPETGEELEAIPADGVRHLAVSPQNLIYAATDTGVLRLGDGKLLVPAGKMDLSGITVAPNGDLLVSDRATHLIRRFTAEGKPAGTIGTQGGPYKGTYDPSRMVNPAGLVFGPDGKLWVAENRWNPKRVLAWNLEKNQVAFEKFGMPHYGGDGSGFDPENPRRWIGLGCFWDVDIATGAARPTHIISLEEGHFGKYHPQSYSFFREHGRTFLCARGKIALISEVLPDGTIRDLAATAGTHHFAYGCGWEPPQAYIDAFYEKWPEKRALEKPMGRKGEGKPWRERGMGVLWVDRNGDGEPQKEEFDFCGDDIAYCDGAWGHLQNSLTFSVPVADKTRTWVAAIEPKGFLPNGVPDYPTLDEAIAAATPVNLTPGYQRNGVPTVRDNSGRFIFNSDPEMNAYAADGRHLWTYPNQWSNVHGSHKAPLPEPGVMQGTLGILGLAPFDERGDVFFLNGNHGRCFILTSDGLYLDEAFVDVRVSYLKNEYRLGGEIFGGSFARSATDGKYYVQIGHGPYRIYELTGLQEARRIEGMLAVTAEQIATAEARNLRRAAESQVAREATLPGKVSWDKSGKFRVELELDADATHLHLHYRVQDPSPWVNNGRDWTKLFATGDTVDLQIATDPAADPRRRGPVPGDKRLLIAGFEGEPVAVLYEHRKPGGDGNNAIEFTSPWRGEKVDNVQKLPEAKIEVKTGNSSYEVKASIRLEDLGLELKPGETYRADFGVTYGDVDGTDTNLRSYWSNPSTGLVDDIPGEIMLSPAMWGDLTVEP